MNPKMTIKKGQTHSWSSGAFTLSPQAQGAALYIYGDIGEDFWGDESLTAKSVVDQLEDLPDGPLEIRVNSFGGSVADALAIYNAIRRHKGSKTAYIDGVAMSAASMVAMAGDRVIAAENSMLMVHAPQGIAMGDAADMRQTADLLDKFAAAMVSTYARSGKSEDEILALLTDGQDHFYTAEEAVAEGFADEIGDAIPIAAHFQNNRFLAERTIATAAQVAAQPRSRTMATKDDSKATPNQDAVNVENERQQAIAAERQRVSEITTIAARFDRRDLADQAIAEGQSANDFRAALLDDLAKGQKQKKPEPAVPPTPTPIARPDPDVTPTYKRWGKMKGFQREADAYAAGQWAMAMIYRKPQAMQWCKDHLGWDVRAALSEGIATKGGVLVPEEMSQAIIDLREQYGVARSLADVVPMGSDTLTVPRRTGGVTAYYVGENKEITGSDAAWDQVNLVARKLAALVLMSSEVAEDAIIDLGSRMADEIAYAFATAEDDAYFNGDGTSTYGGIVGIRTKLIDGTHTAGAIDATAGDDQFEELILADFNKVVGTLPEYARAGARWVISRPGFANSMERLMAAAGGHTFATLEGGAAQMSPQFLGYPVTIAQKMPTALTALDAVVMLLFGNFRLGSTIGDRRSITIAEDSSRYFEYDQIAIRGTQRFDCNIHDLGDTSTAGPIVGLLGNTS